MKYVLLPLNWNLNDVEVADIIRKSGTKEQNLLRKQIAPFFPFNAKQNV